MKRYELLNKGERVRVGDDYFSDGASAWTPITVGIIHWWGPTRKAGVAFSSPVRRKPADTKAR